MLATWTSRESAAWLIVLGVVAVASWTSLDTLDGRLPGPVQPLSLLITLSLGAGALMVSGSFVLGGLGMVLAGAVKPVVLLGLISPTRSGGRSAGAVAWPIFLALLVNGVCFAELPRHVALLLAVAPGAAWIGMVGPLRRLGPRGAAISCGFATAVPAGLALALAMAASPPLFEQGAAFPRRGTALV